MIWIVRNNIFAYNKRLICSKKYVENSRTCWLPILSIGNIRTQRSGGQQTSAPLFFSLFWNSPAEQVRQLPRCARTVLHDQPLRFWKNNPKQTEKWMAQHHRSSQIWVLKDSKSLGVICDLCNWIQKNGLLCFASATKAAAPTSVHDEWRSLATASFEYNSSKHLKAICFLSHFEISEIDWNPRGHHDC